MPMIAPVTPQACVTNAADEIARDLVLPAPLDVILDWLIAIVGITDIHANVGSRLHRQLQPAEHPELRGRPPARAQRAALLRRHRAGRDRREQRTVSRPGRSRACRRAAGPVAQVDHVSRIDSPYDGAKGADQIAPSGRIAFANVDFDVDSGKVSERESKSFVSLVDASLGGGVEFAVGGEIAENAEPQSSTTGLQIGFAAAAVVLFLVFGSLLATLLPLLTAAPRSGSASRSSACCRTRSRWPRSRANCRC